MARARIADEIGEASVRAALGPNVWLFKEKPRALAINLNTAEREALLELPGIDTATADRAVDSRRGKGPFKDLNDFAKRSGVSPAVLAQLADMRSAMTKAGKLGIIPAHVSQVLAQLIAHEPWGIAVDPLPDR